MSDVKQARLGYAYGVEAASYLEHFDLRLSLLEPLIFGMKDGSSILRTEGRLALVKI